MHAARPQHARARVHTRVCVCARARFPRTYLACFCMELPHSHSLCLPSPFTCPRSLQTTTTTWADEKQLSEVDAIVQFEAEPRSRRFAVTVPAGLPPSFLHAGLSEGSGVFHELVVTPAVGSSFVFPLHVGAGQQPERNWANAALDATEFVSRHTGCPTRVRQACA